MRFATPAFLVVLVVILALAAVDAQPSGDPTKTRENGRPTSSREAEPGGKGAEPRRPGGFNQSSGDVQGRYVSFQVDLARCSLRGFEVYGVAYFDEVRLSGTDCTVPKGAAKARMEIEADGAALRIHDAPNALISATLGENHTLTLTLNAAVQGTAEGRRVDLSAGNLSARVFTPRGANDSAMQFRPPTITVHGVDADVVFHPLAGHTAERRAILNAISQGKVGAQVDVLLGADGAEGEVLAFDEVDLRMRRSGNERFDFVVAANLTEGRVILTNFDPAAFDPARVRVDYADVGDDGDRRPVRIREAGSLDQVLNFTSGGTPLYYVFEDDQGHHVAVAVPEFSVHAFEVVGLPLQVVPLLMYGIVIVGLFFATGGVGVVLERRARKQRGR